MVLLITLNHNLLLPKLNEYGFSFNAINWFKAICRNDFTELIQIIISANCIKYSWEYRKGYLGVPLGFLLFNILINNIFYFIQETYICDSRDDNSLHSIENNFKKVKPSLKKNFELLQVWFYENHMVLNTGE